MSLRKFKRMISLEGSSTSRQPEVGFKILHCEEKQQLTIRVIGARNLPTIYGNTKPQGYLLKVRVFPGRDKYETQVVKDPDPMFNQEFNFDLKQTPLKSEDPFLGSFVVFTVYAILESEELKDKLKPRESFSKQFRNFVGFKERRDFIRENRVRNSRNRISLSNRRTVGAVTYNLDRKLFSQRMRYNCFGTPDVWREVQNISSGVQSETKEVNKGTIELTMTYSNSEDGNNEMVEASLSKLRCSMQTMQEHEKYGGSLYIKMTAYEYDVLIASWKSTRFEPTISMKIEAKTATLQATFRSYNVDNIRVVIRLICKNMLAKKILLGKIEIDGKSDLWKQIVENPSTPVTQMINFI